jgi:hypothetical protein
MSFAEMLPLFPASEQARLKALVARFNDLYRQKATTTR